MFFTVFFLSFSVLVNAVIVNAVNPWIRATALSVNVVIIHLLGDAISPFIVGLISDLSDLRVAISITPVMIAISGFILLYGAKISGEKSYILETETSISDTPP